MIIVVGQLAKEVYGRQIRVREEMRGLFTCTRVLFSSCYTTLPKPILPSVHRLRYTVGEGYSHPVIPDFANPARGNRAPGITEGELVT